MLSLQIILNSLKHSQPTYALSHTRKLTPVSALRYAVSACEQPKSKEELLC